MPKLSNPVQSSRLRKVKVIVTIIFWIAGNLDRVFKSPAPHWSIPPPLPGFQRFVRTRAAAGGCPGLFTAIRDR
jgi:hypothetical protein